VGLFLQKRKVSTEEFCTEFYEQSIFSPEISGVDVWRIFCETSYKTIAEADSRFEQVAISPFTSELQALYLEVFGIAWVHCLKDRFAPEQSEFTKHYLEERGFAEIWEAMANYNQATAQSAEVGLDAKTRRGRARLVGINVLRTGLFDRWVALGYDPESVARAANRFGSHTASKSRWTKACLSLALTNRLECEVNTEAHLRIQGITHGFYAGASEAIKEVSIVD